MRAEYVSIAFASAFLAILFVLHFLKPEFNPSWRVISEYAIGRFGWLMRLAFFFWGTSVFALLISIWPSLPSTSGTISRWWFVLIALAMLGAGIFKTDPITANTSSRENTIHTLCGAIVILTFPVAATVAAHSLLRFSSWSASQSLLTFATILTWTGLGSFFASIFVSRMMDPSAQKVGPTIYLGWPNRFMVATYTVWLIVVAGIAPKP